MGLAVFSQLGLGHRRRTNVRHDALDLRQGLCNHFVLAVTCAVLFVGWGGRRSTQERVRRVELPGKSAQGIQDDEVQGVISATNRSARQGSGGSHHRGRIVVRYGNEFVREVESAQHVQDSRHCIGCVVLFGDMFDIQANGVQLPIVTDPVNSHSNEAVLAL